MFDFLIGCKDFVTFVANKKLRSSSFFVDCSFCFLHCGGSFLHILNLILASKLCIFLWIKVAFLILMEILEL